MNLIDLAPDLSDFADTAAAIANLDLVISIDSAVAHLAGAIRHNVWTLLSAAPDHRWFLNRVGSPWYPTMRLFRQRKLREWNPVFHDVVEALRTERVAT
jgi:ADP-heptose:LPS heptosyltransferase